MKTILNSLYLYLLSVIYATAAWLFGGIADVKGVTWFQYVFGFVLVVFVCDMIRAFKKLDNED